MESIKIIYVMMSVMLGIFLYRILSKTKSLQDQIAEATAPAPATYTLVTLPTAQSDQSPLSVKRVPDEILKLHINDLDEKILAYLGSCPMDGLSANDLSSILSDSAGSHFDELYINKHIINSRLYTMMRKKKVRQKYMKEGLYWYTD